LAQSRDTWSHSALYSLMTRYSLDSPLLALLMRLPAPDLEERIGGPRLAALTALAGQDLVAPGALSRAAIALEGSGLLESASFRRSCLLLLGTDELRDLAERYASRAFPKPADNATALSTLPWRQGEGFAIEVGRRLGLPRSWLPANGEIEPTSIEISAFKKRAKLRPYQADAVRRVVQALSLPGARAVLQMPTGAGKTRVAVDALVQHVSSRIRSGQAGSVLWLAHVEELCEQAMRAFEDAWREDGAETWRATRCWGSFKPAPGSLSQAFIVSTYQRLTAMRARAPEELLDLAGQVDLVVVDEAHKVLAPSYKALLDAESWREKRVLGLTATPGRGRESAPENLALATFFGRNLIEPDLGDDTIGELRRMGVLATVSYKAIPSGVTLRLSEKDADAARLVDLPSSALKRLADSTERNRLILDEVCAATSAGARCLLFACSVEHSKLLSAALAARRVPAAHIDGETDAAARREMIQRFRAGDLRVLLNFAVLSTGFDAPGIDTLVITRPTSSVVLYSQMVGRGLRGPASGGVPRCTILDVRDNFESFGEVNEVYRTFAQYWC
jgi:DNA repair protein RadD